MNSDKMLQNFVVGRNKCCCYSWRKIFAVVVLLQLIMNCGVCTAAIRSVNLILDPPAVRRNQHATLQCLYDLQGSQLYSVKFYRGRLEFYRFSPSEIPEKKVFPFPGINVDIHHSNASQVVLRNVAFGLSGNFSCEVTAESPSFSTATGHIHMQVVEFPDSAPRLWTERDRYEAGDGLKANCSSPPSRPRAELTLTLNNVVMNTAATQYLQTSDGLISSKLGFRLQLQSLHFSGPNGPGTSLTLRCTAHIGNLYQEYSEIELGMPPKDPVPARVTSSGADTAIATSSQLARFTAWASFSFLIIIVQRFHSTSIR